MGKLIKKVCAIYKLTSPNGKVYIGQSLDVLSRWKYYRKGICKEQPKLYHSLKKYGAENFIYEIIEECRDKTHLNEREAFWCELYNSCEKGLNIMKGGTARLFTPQSAIEKLKRQKISPERIEAMKVGRAKVGAWNKGKKKWCPPEMVESIKDKLRRRPGTMNGKKHKPESIQKMKDNSGSVKLSQEEKKSRKDRMIARGTLFKSEETKQKQSLASKGRKKSEAHVAALTKSWASPERRKRLAIAESTAERKLIRKKAIAKAWETIREKGTATEKALKAWATRRQKQQPIIWTDEKVDILKRSFGSSCRNELCDKVGLSYHYIKIKMKELGLAFGWSEDDEKVLIDNYGKFSAKQIGAMIGKSKGAITGRVRRLRAEGIITFVTQIDNRRDNPLNSHKRNQHY